MMVFRMFMLKIIFNLSGVILLLLGCTNPFSVRNAEPPDITSDSEFYSDATHPDTVFSNFKKSIENRNIPAYMNVFISNVFTEPHAFHFEPEQYFQNDFIQKWTREDEQNYFSRLKNAGTGDFPKLNLLFNNKLELRPLVSGSDNDSLQTNSLEYQFEVNFGDSLITYSGVADFKLFKSQNNQLWYIYYWRDNAINKEYQSTWTYLKTQYK